MKQHLTTLSDYVERSTHWREGGATRHDAILALGELHDGVDWLDRGLNEWRQLYVAAERNRKAVEAGLRIATQHLQAVLNRPRTHEEQQKADTAARDWLVSVGSEP